MKPGMIGAMKIKSFIYALAAAALSGHFIKPLWLAVVVTVLIVTIANVPLLLVAIRRLETQKETKTGPLRR